MAHFSKAISERKSMARQILLILFILLSGSSQAQDEVENYYWLQFSNKTGTSFSIEHPEEFLSPRALARRQKQNIAINEQDLPVSKVYLDSLRSKGAEIVHTSKWLNGATIKATPATYQQILTSCNFIQNSQLTKPGKVLKLSHRKFKFENEIASYDSASYGDSFDQLALFNGQYLHEQNNLGAGVQIAVLDAGFYKVEELPAFTKMRTEHRILGTRDFVEPSGNVFQKHNHGTNVLSTMGGEIEGQLIGTAPEASYYLLRSEDASSEYIIEEDNWVAAAEYADSLGCDIINSSLGYSLFDDVNMNHSYADMNGHTTRISQAANIAVEKGMLVFASAGNEANNPWRYLIAPSDGDLVIGVGAVNKDSIWAPFSSVGPASDGDVKPNLVAVGWGTQLQKTDGSVGPSNGTSFSSPVLAGMAACLWQANPQATNLEIKEALEISASQYELPDSLLGYGIPNFKLADLLLTEPEPQAIAKEWIAFPNPFQNHIYLIRTSKEISEKLTITLFSVDGSLILKKEFQQTSHIFLSNLSNLPSGLILAKIESDNFSSVLKLVKIKAQN